VADDYVFADKYFQGAGEGTEQAEFGVGGVEVD
jgi:hypothetical protein